ncbi:MAG: hypothetical protein IT184_02840 [Acidobacteria bacterium]|nr:hypothetical protein [Acidobacteriota bacterium]
MPPRGAALIGRDARPWRASFALGVALCAAYCALAAASTWPLIDGDGPAYFPAAVEWSRGRGLINPVWLPPLNDTIDGPGGRRLIYHGFTYALVAGTVGRWLGGGPIATVWAAYLIHLLAAVVGALALLMAADIRPATARILGLAAPIAMLACSLATHGRPEPLALVLVSAAVLVWRIRPGPTGAAAAGAAAALLLVTSPACGALALPLLVAAVLTSRRTGSIARDGAAAALGWAAGAAIAVIAYPYPIADWIAGVRRHAAINFSLPLGQGILTTWVTAAELPLLGLTMVLLAGGALNIVVQRLASLSMSRRVVAAASVTLFAAGLARTALLKSEASYNAIVWMPLLAALALSAPRRRVGELVLLLALMPPVAGAVRTAALLAGQYRSTAVTYDDVRRRLRALPADELSISGGLWLAADDSAAVGIIGRDPLRRFVVQQQAKTGQQQPGALAGYALQEDRFGPGSSLWRLPVARTPGGWEFALYLRVP